MLVLMAPVNVRVNGHQPHLVARVLVLVVPVPVALLSAHGKTLPLARTRGRNRCTHEKTAPLA